MFKSNTLSGALLSTLLIAAVIPDGHAQTSSPRLKGALDYEIGGGYMPRQPTKTMSFPPAYTGSVRWNTNLMCGDFDPQITVANQLNGITGGFKQLFGNILQAATGAVASLPALILQRSNPGLYDLISSGTISAKADFEAAELSCESILNEIDERLPWEDMRGTSANETWTNAVENSNGDAVRAKEQVRNTDPGNAGINWVCSQKRGGTGQEPVRTVYDTVIVGYNVLLNRYQCSYSTVYGSEVDSPMVQYWRRPSLAADWAGKVVGEVTLATCDGCAKITTESGKGLVYQHTELRDALETQIEALVNGTTSPITYDRLVEVSAPPGVMVTGVLIRKLQRYSVVGRDETIDRLADEIAYARLVEQARLMIQIIRTGFKEPNVSANEAVKPYIDEAIATIESELELLDKEMTTRKVVAKETIARLLAAEEQKIQQTSKPSSVKPSSVNSVGGGAP